MVRAAYDLDPNASELTPIDEFPQLPYPHRWLVELAPTTPAEDATPRWTIVSWKPLPAVTIRGWRHFRIIRERRPMSLKDWGPLVNNDRLWTAGLKPKAEASEQATTPTPDEVLRRELAAADRALATAIREVNACQANAAIQTERIRQLAAGLEAMLDRRRPPARGEDLRSAADRKGPSSPRTREKP